MAKIRLLKWIVDMIRDLIESWIGHALLAIGGLAIGIGVQMSARPIAVIGSLTFLAGFWIVGL